MRSVGRDEETSYAELTPEGRVEAARRMVGSSFRGWHAQEMIFENLIFAWSYRDDAAVRAWLVPAPELSSEHKRVRLWPLDERECHLNLRDHPRMERPVFP